MSDRKYISLDDIFVLSQLGAHAVVYGLGDKVQKTLEFIQTECADNAGGFLMQSIHLFSSGKVKEAIAFLEASPALSAEKNRDEALAFHLLLLQADGQTARIRQLGNHYLATNAITSESAHYAVRTILQDVEG
ncbi:hypothetical protein [Epibacterium ulvae]|uniref:hypothetical protein n=1 Tax=Epibacterium ulvae TaxID=1156985 RepID=UPI00248FE577|nr:hypothetical protein [Epibacterium ulvae]